MTDAKRTLSPAEGILTSLQAYVLLPPQHFAASFKVLNYMSRKVAEVYKQIWAYEAF